MRVPACFSFAIDLLTFMEAAPGRLPREFAGTVAVLPCGHISIVFKANATSLAGFGAVPPGSSYQAVREYQTGSPHRRKIRRRQNLPDKIPIDQRAPKRYEC